MPAPSRSTCHGHQCVPGRSGEQQKQADLGPGRTHTHLSWMKPTTHLEAPEQPIPAWFVLRHLSHPPASASGPKTVGSVATLQELVASWEAQRAELLWRPRSIHGLTPCPLLQGRVLRSVLPCPERLQDRQNLHGLTTVLLTHRLCTRIAQDGDAFSLLYPSAELVQAHRGS